VVFGRDATVFATRHKVISLSLNKLFSTPMKGYSMLAPVASGAGVQYAPSIQNMAEKSARPSPVSFAPTQKSGALAVPPLYCAIPAQWVVIRTVSAESPFMPFDDDGSAILRQTAPSAGMVVDLKFVSSGVSSLHVTA
jgi:hypothetical protein